MPSIESGQKSNVKWHFARTHAPEHIIWLKNTPTGRSAFDNIEHYPKKKNGEKIKSYNTTYRRMEWDAPAPTITIRNDAISSQLNVHPGRSMPDGTYSDARVLTPLELMLLTSLPIDWNIPDDTSELLIRQCIGESIPPLLIKKIVERIGK
nr:DNA cytosine methyltransferase [Neisseria meningitidis]